jgi:hypothetical protein
LPWPPTAGRAGRGECHTRAKRTRSAGCRAFDCRTRHNTGRCSGSRSKKCARVFALGRIYGGGRFYESGVTQGKRAFLSLTTGGPKDLFLQNGFHGDIHGILKPIHRGMHQYGGWCRFLWGTGACVERRIRASRPGRAAEAGDG